MAANAPGCFSKLSSYKITRTTAPLMQTVAYDTARVEVMKEAEPDDTKIAEIDQELEHWSKERRRKYARFTLCVLSSIPWLGGFLSASASFQAESDQSRINELLRQWLQEHQRKLQALGRDLAEIVQRLDELGSPAEARIEDPDYLLLVEQAFRTWDKAATEEKRDLIKKILSNAAGTSLCSDDVIRLFIEWIDYYHEAHFAVIREIYAEPGVTRGEIWDRIYGRPVREDSAEADLFKLLMRDLSTGGVIRQHRETTATGEFVRKRRPTTRAHAASIMKSAFDSQEPYELTELGKQFVHYAMTDVVPRIASTREGAG
jgi:DNA-binding transcriptional MerR regulator